MEQEEWWQAILLPLHVLFLDDHFHWERSDYSLWHRTPGLHDPGGEQYQDRKAWIHTQFAAANIGSAILVSSNPTNLVLAGAFDIKFIH